MTIGWEQLRRFGIALVLALVLWSFVSFTTNPSVDQPRTVQVAITNLAPGMLVVEPTLDARSEQLPEVTFQVTGPQDVMARLQPDDFKAHLDLAGLSAGQHTVPIIVEQPVGVRVHSLTPPALSVQLDQFASRTVPVVVKRRGQVPFLFNLGELRQSRTEVTVSGPATVVAQAVSGQVVLNVENQTSDLTTVLPIQPVDQTGNPLPGVTAAPGQVEVSVSITARVQGQRISVVPNYVGSPAPGYVLSGLEWEPQIVNVLTPNLVTGTLTT